VIYFDSSYLVRLYFADPGFEQVRELAATDALACAEHGRAEVVAALHRKRREGSLTERLFALVLKQFAHDRGAGAFTWLALSHAVLDRVEDRYARLPSDIAVRAADALHLACAAENGFREIYTNDHRLIDAAPHFGLTGVDVI